MSLPVGPAVEGWNPPPWPPAQELVGERVRVKPLTREAYRPLWEAFSHDDGSMWTYLGYGPFRTPEELAATADAWIGGRDPLFFTFDVEGRPVGWGAYLRIVPADGVIEVGHLAFGPSLRRTAAATEAMYLMMRNVFELGYRRYEWKCDALNHASRHAAVRLGFTYEGTFRQHMIYKGRNRNTAWYSITDGEWPRVRAALETWLDPANFDQQGRQISPLTVTA